MSGEPQTTAAAWQELLEPLRAEPARTAILTDFDGALAPIVERPEEAALLPGTREILVRLIERYGLVGAISGRRVPEVRGRLGLDAMAYAGNHGLELVMPGGGEPTPGPTVAGQGRDAAEFLAGLGPSRLDLSGLRVEDKGPIQALHWRGAEDPAAVEAALRAVADEARRAGLEPHWGRKILELRPLGGGGKDAAVGALLADERLDRAIYAGDDRTDVDAFRRLGELRDEGRLVVAVRVGILSAEGPPEIAEESDITVEGPAGWLAILDWLAR